METLEGLNELIKKRLIEKKGNIKLTENNDIVLYGKALGISENQLLFKILDISETIDWTEMENGTNTASNFHSNNIICKNCNAPNEKGVANFCEECGSELNPQQQPQQKALNEQKEPVVFDPEPTKKSNTLLIIVLSAVALIIVAIGIYYFKNKNQSENFDANEEVAVDTTGVAVDTAAVDYNNVAVDTTAVVVDTTDVVQNDYGDKYDNFIKYDTNCIKDLNTNYYWYIAPDRDFDFDSANSFSNNNNTRNLNWRIPTYDEIKTLYNSNYSAGEGYYANNEYYPAKIHTVFNAVGSGSWFWVSDRNANVTKAYAINLHEGLKVNLDIQNPGIPVHLLLISN